MFEEIDHRRGYGRWYLDPELLEDIQAVALSRGMDLFAWLRTGDPRHLKWVTVTTPMPFGERALGTQVCPMWPKAPTATCRFGASRTWS